MKYVNERTGLLILVLALYILAFVELNSHRFFGAMVDAFLGFVVYRILEERIREKFFKLPIEEEVNDEL